jgi:hypothetical protein
LIIVELISKPASGCRNFLNQDEVESGIFKSPFGKGGFRGISRD